MNAYTLAKSVAPVCLLPSSAGHQQCNTVSFSNFQAPKL